MAQYQSLVNLNREVIEMLENAFNCASCDTTCYQECTGCSGECTGSCQGGCDGSCMFNCNDTCYHNCIGTCDNTCSGTCSISCSGGLRSSTSSNDLFTLCYVSYTVGCRPKIVRVSDDTFVLLFAGYQESITKVVLIAFRIDSNGFITYGTQTSCDINCTTSDVLSLYDYDSTCGIKQLIVANNINSATITVFTINVSDSLDITIGTSSNISSTANPSRQYAQYKPGYTPTPKYNFVKLMKDTNGSDVYIVSISCAKQFSLCIGSIESNGIVLNTSATVDADYGISDPSYHPELFFEAYMNYQGSYSIENWFIEGSVVRMLSTSYYTASTDHSFDIQNRALILSWNCGNMIYNYEISTINCETPFIVDIYKLPGSLKSYDNLYIVIDYMYIMRQTDYQAIRITPYAFVDNKFIQCGSGKIIRGLVKGPVNTSHEYISSVVVINNNITPIFVCAEFYDNLIHTQGKRYITQLLIHTIDSLDIVAINVSSDDKEIPDVINNYDAPLLKCFVCNNDRYLIICDAVVSGGSNVSTVLLAKLYIDGSTAPGYGIKSIQTLYTHTILYFPNRNNMLFQQVSENSFRMLFAASSNAGTSYIAGRTCYDKESLCVISVELDSEGVPTITTTDYTTLIATNDDGTVGLPTASCSMVIDEMFHDNLLLVITQNKIILYYWSPTDNLFYIKDTYTISGMFDVLSGYYKNEWYFRYSDDEIMLLDVNKSKKGMLLQITPDAKIINLGYSSMDNVIETFNTKTHKMTNIDGTPYLINSTGNGAIAAAPLKVSRVFKKLGGYVNANPMTIVMDDSTFEKCCKTITPYMEVEEEKFIEGGVIIIPPIG